MKKKTREPTNGANEIILLTAIAIHAAFGILNLHHVGILWENLEQTFDFYQNLFLLGMCVKIKEARPHDKLPYRRCMTLG
ncbi:putative glyoxalase/Bleomycin resistance protein/Dihydroxybiphenyl dioxygenase [Helianthus annuus]|nr:putative glyoxalase/Bleomycin resistance protein/Dihydroxybiphenyl dioxygenase [Helianthus annuus]